jgi:hypothetical protein
MPICILTILERNKVYFTQQLQLFGFHRKGLSLQTVNDLTGNIKFLAKSFNDPHIPPLQNTRKYSEDTGLGKLKWQCFFSRYNTTNFISTSEKTHHTSLKISIVFTKNNRQVTYMYMRNPRVLFDKHSYILDISSQQNDNLLFYYISFQSKI